MKKAQIGYQIYSAREDAAKDLPAVLKQLKALGYDCVELAGLYDYTAAQIKAMVDEAGLTVVSAHVPYQAMLDDINKVISDYKLLGCKYVAIPFLGDADRPGTPGFATVIKNIYKFGAMFKLAGIQLLYHNHDFEFVKISDMYALDFLYEAVPAEILQTEIDCCWVKYSGVNPAEYLRKYAGRAEVVHMKDFVGRKGGKQPYALINTDGSDDGKNNDDIAFEFRPVGHGSQNVQQIVDAALEGGAEYFIVEQDQWYDRTPMEAAKMSIESLKKCGL